MHEIAQILSAIAWPVVVIFCIVSLQPEIVAMMQALAQKIKAANKIKITKSGIELAEEVARKNIIPSNIVLTSRHETAGDEFARLINEYDHCDITDVEQRVTARRRLADRLGQLSIDLDMSRQALAMSDSEGKLVALATAVVLEPASADLVRLEQAVRRANFNFTRYRLVLALLPTLTHYENHKRTLRRALAVLDAAETRPNTKTDLSLKVLVEKTRAVVEDLLNG